MTPQITNIKLDQYTQEDDYRLEKLSMTGTSGQTVNLKPLFVTFSFVEDIFSCAISGSVLIKDAVNLFSAFPINGYETIEVSFKTPGIDSEEITKTFDVVEITEKVRAPNERAEVYRINFVSQTATKDKLTTISKSYKGKISDIVEKIYSEYLAGPSNTLKKPQETLEEKKYVIPRWSPFRALTWLAKRAEPVKESNETNFLFFENVDGHNFISLSELVSQDPVIEYFNIPVLVGGGSKELAKNFLNVKNSLFLKSSQKLKEQMSGAYTSTLYTHDVTTKQWNKYTYKHSEDNIRHITDNKLTMKNDKYESNPNSVVHLSTKQSALMGKDYPNIQNQEKWLQRTISSDVLVDTIKLKITTSGNSRLRVGNVIEFYTPKTGSLESPETAQKWYDEKFSGKYLITNLRHTITPEGYTNTIGLAKNSYEQRIPEIVAFLGTGAVPARSPSPLFLAGGSR